MCQKSFTLYVSAALLNVKMRFNLSDALKLTETGAGNCRRRPKRQRPSNRAFYRNPAARSPCTWVSRTWRRRDELPWRRWVAAGGARAVPRSEIVPRPRSSRLARWSPWTLPTCRPRLPPAASKLRPARRSWRRWGKLQSVVWLLLKLLLLLLRTWHMNVVGCVVARFYRDVTVAAAAGIYINSLPNCRLLRPAPTVHPGVVLAGLPPRFEVLTDRRHTKMSPLWKIRLGRNNHGIDMSPLNRWPSPISLHIIGLPHPFPPKNSLPGQQFIGKNLSRPSGRRAGWIFAGKLSAGGDFSGGRNPIMGHLSGVGVSRRRLNPATVIACRSCPDVRHRQ